MNKDEVAKDGALEDEVPAACCTSDFNELFPRELFRALSDGNRIALLAQLATAQGPQTVTEASGCCPTDISVTSRHLSILRQAGIVEAWKEGRRVLYSVRYQELSGALRRMADAIDSCCPPESLAADAGTTQDHPGNGRLTER